MLNAQAKGAALVLRLTEKRIDAARAPRFREEVLRHIDEGAHLLVLDFSEVDFVDSSGLGAIVSCLKRLGPRGNMAIACPRGAVAKLFALTRMDKVFQLHDTVDGAVERITS